MGRDVEQVSQRVRAGWSSATASTWTADSPARGQCSVTALVAQDALGGALLKTRVGEARHFYNRIGAERVDLTASQFEGAIGHDDLPATREECLADISPEQYRALAEAVRIGGDDCCR